ncbi:RidA family protein [Lysinibacter sp. HNR]|uniref:RidA family protein n=1 Tax=Lysinibacter sp. HNR TaxID=3031408 RepID=UPI002434AA27|nr:RidA family protein [Lysinibacter sp. HNR]WGD37491.1 RidA family protein [Lysinibacter sp. HNR]
MSGAASSREIGFNLSPFIPGLSETVVVPPGASLIHTSGHTAGLAAEVQTFETQLDITFATLDRALRNAGASMKDVIRLTYYVTDLSSRSIDTLRTVRDRWVDTARPPASALLGIEQLYHPDIYVEIDAIAAVVPREE